MPLRDPYFYCKHRTNLAIPQSEGLDVLSQTMKEKFCCSFSKSGREKGLIILIIQIKMFMISSRARVAELADALDLGSSPERGRGSNPLSRTSPPFSSIGRNPAFFIVPAPPLDTQFPFWYFYPAQKRVLFNLNVAKKYSKTSPPPFPPPSEGEG